MQAIQALEKLRELGFHFLTLQSYERQVAAERDGFVTLLEATPGGQIRQLSAAGYLLDGQIAMLVERGAAVFFVAKQKELPATPDLLVRYRRFQHDLSLALNPPV